MCIISREIVERAEEEIWCQLICMTKREFIVCSRASDLSLWGLLIERGDVGKAASLLPLNPLQFRPSALSYSLITFCCCAPTIAHMTSVSIILSPENASKTACVLFFVFFLKVLIWKSLLEFSADPLAVEHKGVLVQLPVPGKSLLSL